MLARAIGPRSPPLGEQRSQNVEPSATNKMTAWACGIRSAAARLACRNDKAEDRSRSDSGGDQERGGRGETSRHRAAIHSGVETARRPAQRSPRVPAAARRNCGRHRERRQCRHAVDDLRVAVVAARRRRTDHQRCNDHDTDCVGCNQCCQVVSISAGASKQPVRHSTADPKQQFQRLPPNGPAPG